MKNIIAVFCLSMLICKVKTQTIPVNKNSFDYEGHRGCRGLMPENTIAAMMKALTLKVTTLEMDLHITSDKQVILSHDHWLNPSITTKPDGSFIADGDTGYVLYSMNYDSIRQFDIGKKPNSLFPQQKKVAAVIPRLQELIDSVETWCNAHRKTIGYNMEIKSSPQGDNVYHPDIKTYVDLVMQVLLKSKIEKRVIIQSFDMRALQYLHKQYPYMRASLLTEKTETQTPGALFSALGFIPTILSPNYQTVNKAMIEACHAKQVKVIPWTVNNTDNMKELQNLNVDGLISDYPDLYSKLP